MSSEPMVLSNEFATVRVQLDTEANGPRLRVEDTSTGIAIYLDPLELQSLAWATHADLAVFARPFFKERAYERMLGRVVSTMAVEEAEELLRRLESDE
jgi:hypothetical protein